MYNYICKNCKKEFHSNIKNRIFCSKKCSNSGKNNPMYGKKHTNESKKKNSESNKANITKELKEKHSKRSKQWHKEHPNAYRGENNPMYGRDMSGKNNGMYGKHLTKEHKNALSKRFSGKGNPMYGRPAPQGAGNGWSGWYKNMYFRSILELSYMVHFEKNNIKFISAEKMRIPYKFMSKDRTYSPDFYLPDTDTVIECKYKKLIKSKNNIAKFEAAILFFKNFKIMTEEDVKLLKKDDIMKLYDNKKLRWNKLYEQKFIHEYF